MLKRLLALVYIGIISLGVSPFARGQAQLKDEATQLEATANSLSNKFQVLVDTSGQLTVDQILARGLDKFSSEGPLTIHPGYTSAHYWLEIKLQNSTDNLDWFVIPDYPIMKFEAYAIEPNGLYQPIEVEPFETRFPIRKIRIGKGEEKHILLKVWSPLVVNLQFQVLDVAHLKSRISTENTFLGVIAGIFIAMIVYNIFLYVSLRDRDYLYYLAFAIANTHINLLSAAYPENIFEWFGVDWWVLIDVYRPLAPLTTLLFARSFLQMKTQQPRLDLAIKIYSIGLLLFMAASFFVPRHILFPLEDSYFLIAIILLLAAGVQSLRLGFHPSHYYLVGLILFTVGMGIYIVKSEGLLPTNAFTLNAHIFGQALEMLLMSLGLSAKIKQLESSKIQAEATARVKGRLLRVISHDIANPLSIIKGMAYVLRKEKVGTTRIDAISRAVGVIEEIMKFVHKTESLDGGGKLADENVSLPEVFDSLQFVFQKLAGDKEITITFSLDPSELFVKADKTSLTYEVLANFIGNAIKFSHNKGEVKVRATSFGSKVLISIEDSGIGMSERAVAGAFNPMINVSRRGTAGEKGGGYGLLLAKAYLDQYGGTVTIESVSQEMNPEQSGTRILITLLGTKPLERSLTRRQKWRLVL